MFRILLVSADRAGLAGLAQGLEQSGQAAVSWAASGQEALQKAAQSPAPHLVIIDGPGPNTQAFALINQLMQVNAMINTAVVTTMDAEELHEAGEGLGIMAPLPPRAGADQVAPLLEKLSGLVIMPA